MYAFEKHAHLVNPQPVSASAEKKEYSSAELYCKLDTIDAAFKGAFDSITLQNTERTLAAQKAAEEMGALVGKMAEAAEKSAAAAKEAAEKSAALQAAVDEQAKTMAEAMAALAAQQKAAKAAKSASAEAWYETTTAKVVGGVAAAGVVAGLGYYAYNKFFAGNSAE